MEMANLSNLLLKLLNKVPWRLIRPWLLQFGYDTSRSRLEKSLAWGTVPALQVC
jgi:hypothetical protein